MPKEQQTYSAGGRGSQHCYDPCAEPCVAFMAGSPRPCPKGHDIEVLVDARLLRQAWVCMQALLFHLQYCEVAIEQRTRTRLLRYTLDHLVYSRHFHAELSVSPG